jgi:hypothetical protein
LIASGQRLLPVEENERFLGMICLQDLIKSERGAHDRLTARDIMIPAAQLACATPRQDVAEALAVLAQRRVNQLPVVDGEKLVGFLNVGADSLIAEVAPDRRVSLPWPETRIRHCRSENFPKSCWRLCSRGPQLTIRASSWGLESVWIARSSTRVSVCPSTRAIQSHSLRIRSATTLCKVNANDIATTGARPLWLLVTLLLPEGRTTAELAEVIMMQIYEAAKDLGVALIGGHTEITAGLTRPIAIGTMIGEVARESLITPRGAQSGNRVLLTYQRGTHRSDCTACTRVSGAIKRRAHGH